MKEAHLRVCGAHQAGPKLCDRIQRSGYYGPTRVHYVKRCKPYQFHANFIHQPPKPLHLTMVFCPF